MPNTSIFILFAPKFKQFGCDIGKEYIHRKGGGKVHGLCTGPISVKRYVEKELGNDAGYLWHLHTEEIHWLNDQQPLKNLSQIDIELGPGAVGRIMAADRRVGRGFVRGGLCKPDILGRACVQASASLPLHYVSGLYAFLDQVLKKAKPTSVFCYAVAGAPALALAEICKARQIPFSRLSNSRIGVRYLIDDDCRGRLHSVARSYGLAMDGKKHFGSNLTVAKSLLQTFQKRPEQSGNVKRNHALFRSKKLLKSTIRAVKITIYNAALFLNSFSERRSRIIQSWFEVWVLLRKKFILKWNFASKIPESSSYILYPLHVDPEASTMVLSPWHTDQIHVIESLAKSAPANMLLVVKEHLPMLGRRPVGFYKHISMIPRVVLLGPEHNGLSLISKASLVAVISGTAAWEAMRLKRPTLVIGDSPYLAIKSGVVHEPCLTNLPTAIIEALSLPPATDTNLETYIAACLDESFELNPGLIWGQYGDHSETEKRTAVSNFVHGILKREQELRASLE
jgi:hypothetical protein